MQIFDMILNVIKYLYSWFFKLESFAQCIVCHYNNKNFYYRCEYLTVTPSIWREHRKVNIIFIQVTITLNLKIICYYSYFSPLLWGHEACRIYKERERKNWLLWEQPTVQDVMSLLSEKLVMASLKKFPFDRLLEVNKAEDVKWNGRKSCVTFKFSVLFS